MQVIYSVDDFPSDVETAVTIGTFDGVHTGHRKIFEELIKTAKESKLKSVVFTFEPHPRKVLTNNNSSLDLITITEEKIELFKLMSLDFLVIQKFSKNFSKIDPLDFIRDFLVDKLNLKYLIVGYDHQFGKNRNGTFDSLQQYSQLLGFSLKKIDVYKNSKIVVSSTKIRSLISSGMIEMANRLLGYRYFFSGIVTKGNEIGKELGFATANLQISEEKVHVQNGVYAVHAYVKNVRHSAMMNVGYNPTFENDIFDKKKVEVHIFNFKENIYGEIIKVEVIKKIRNEVKFESKDKLIDQLNIDKQTSLSIIQEL